jgi:hypothetical protein
VAQAGSVADYSLKAVWNKNGGSQDLKSWALTDLTRLKKISVREKDPATGTVSSWQGTLLSDLVDTAMSSLPPDSRAQIDLIILKNDTAGQAMIPRAFITKYPVVLAFSRDQRELGALGPVYSVVPWTSRPKSQTEGLPLESYFLTGVKRVELTNYRDLYGSLFLKRRTDPAAMRGEKLFVQNCAVCHAPAENFLRNRMPATDSHPSLKGAPKLNDRDRRSLSSYFEAYRLENGITKDASKSASIF